MLTRQRLFEVLDYNPDTGIFTWKISTTNKIKIGDVAGSLHSHGYLQTSIDGRKYYLHVLAWFGMTGNWPLNDIDHKDLNKSNNKWGNLREATRRQNNYNVKVKKISSTQIKNVYYEKRRNKYRVSIRANGKRNFIGYFDTEIEANKASEDYMKKHHKEWYAEAELKDGIVVKVK